MKIVFKVQTIMTFLFGGIIQSQLSPQCAVSFIVGSALILLSFVLMSVGFQLIISKKLIALAIGIIVFKYAILGIIIYNLVHSIWFKPLWFSLGVASFILSGFYYATKEALREGKQNVI